MTITSMLSMMTGLVLQNHSLFRIACCDIVFNDDGSDDYVDGDDDDDDDGDDDDGDDDDDDDGNVYAKDEDCIRRVFQRTP